MLRLVIGSVSQFLSVSRARKERKEGRDRRNHRSITKKRKGKEMTLRWVPSCRVLPSFFLSVSFLPRARVPKEKQEMKMKRSGEEKVDRQTTIKEVLATTFYFSPSLLSSFYFLMKWRREEDGKDWRDNRRLNLMLQAILLSSLQSYSWSHHPSFSFIFLLNIKEKGKRKMDEETNW